MLTEPTRYLPHRQDNALRSIAVSVKVFTQNSQDAHLGAVLLRAKRVVQHNATLMAHPEDLQETSYHPPLVESIRSYSLWSKFKISDTSKDTNWSEYTVLKKKKRKEKLTLSSRGLKGPEPIAV